MAGFNQIKLTNKGQALQAKAQIGTQLDFTRIGIGDGELSLGQDIKELEDLVSEKMSLGIESMESPGDGTATLMAYLSNQGLSEGFYLREIGVFANDPDEGEILYSVTNAGEHPDFLPADSGNVAVESNLKIVTIVGDAENVTATIASGIYATKEELEELEQQLEGVETLPPGGTTGQVLMKKSDADGDAEWGNYIYLSVNVSTENSASVEGDEVTITNTDTQEQETFVLGSDGIAKFTIVQLTNYRIDFSEKSSYVAPTPIIFKSDTIGAPMLFTAQYNSLYRYGIKIDKNNSNPNTRVEYLYNAIDKTPAYMDFSTGQFNYGDWEDFCTDINKPVMLKYNGEVDYELDRNDQTKKASDGSASDVSNTAYEGNAMSQFKRLWIKQYEDNDYEYIIFSNGQYDSDYKAHAFTNENDEIQDYMYRYMYDGSYVAPRLRSLATGSTMVDESGDTEISRAEANGDGWYIEYKSQRDFVMYLLWLISKSTADQEKYGTGNSNSGTVYGPGETVEKGQFHGDDDGREFVKVFYIENFWGNTWNRLAGMLLINGVIHTRLKPPYNNDGTGYIDTGVTPSGTSGEYLKDAKVLSDAGFIPDNTDGSATTYYTCGLWFNTDSTTKYALVGGRRAHGSLCGAGTVRLTDALSNSYSTIGAGLSFLKNPS